MKNWQKNGCHIPPPHSLKQVVIEKYAQLNHIKVLVETGTYYGDMVESQKFNFEKIFSIELGKELWENAVLRFKKYKHIFILPGDSGKVLNDITSKLNEKALFWLDGHYSDGITTKGDKECPIIEEVNAIFRYKNLSHVILVDDARCFNGEGDYPTIEHLTNHIHQYDNRYNVSVEHDIIRYVIEK